MCKVGGGLRHTSASRLAAWKTGCCTKRHASKACTACRRGDGFQFDQLAFVASQGRNEKAQNFARLFRHSQLYEVFVNERLKLASQDYRTSDNFECKVDQLHLLQHAPISPAKSLLEGFSLTFT